MKINKVIPGLAAAVIGGSMLLAPIAGAATLPAAAVASAQASGGTDPLLPYGTETHVPGHVGYVDSNHDEANTTNGQIDVPF